MNGRWVIYPCTKFVAEYDIRMALTDAIANEEAGPVDVDELPLDEVCNILQDIGTFTFAAPNADEANLRHASQMEAMEVDLEYGQ